MQAMFRISSGTRSRSSWGKRSTEHQQGASGSAPGAIAQWFSFPQRGQREVSTVELMMIGMMWIRSGPETERPGIFREISRPSKSQLAIAGTLCVAR